MKYTLISKTALTAVLASAFVGAASATIVYQDTFNDGVASTNPDIGGGLDTTTGSVTSSPLLEFFGSIGQGSTTSGGAQGIGLSTNAFDLSGGFTLSVTFSVLDSSSPSSSASAPPYPSNSFSFGLVDATTDIDDFLGFHVEDGSSTTLDGIGYNTNTRENSTTGLNFGDGTTASNLSNGQVVVDGAQQTFELTVDANGNFSYSLNGAVASTGTTTLDLSDEYKFAIFSQGTNGGSIISDVTLETVPEPSSAALLGLGGLALILRRRR
ncbi:PEP-CTERM sorting domain-containing protein [Verrucomicrobiaceae bacterium 5K15]|uniref:PEP-CTERM sorting domain-containing protein n=1 Tax=Oceaniferula flava TaxID=2800421 RepID=A0AAE2SC79_9BACT|nr:PEP-CTERM sorting domain-containing protein [Oceaniferula flavus]MBK1854737.1 PEP-CTERM sorting domain-containing protein [Oceaniferula flavus]MBM1136043.1 PEP-CTERM sorting domain-containing protein [Oceaniferula flavus]